MSFVCVRCSAPAESYATRCAACGKASTLRPVTSTSNLRHFPAFAALIPPPSAASGLGDGTPAPMRARTESLSRAKTGLEPLDLALGGGLVDGSAILLSGPRGAGKSTLALWLLAAFPESTAGGALYVSSEETRDQVEDRATRTLPTVLGSPLQCTRNLAEVLRYAEGRRLTILDSLHGLDGRLEENARSLRGFCKDRHTTLVCIAHLVKDGSSVRGAAEIEYLFDAHFRLDREDARVRILETMKNRYGEEGAWRLQLATQGWEPAPPPPEESPPLPPEASPPPTPGRLELVR